MRRPRFPDARPRHPEPAERVHHPREAAPLPDPGVAAVHGFGFGGSNATVVPRRD
ncbi:hypothetical protein [Streptomyces sp. NRRL S-350]|uniref:hypothetical protein n=1 Tax=Streptomyces sp. NRRL S-350 TaxID=1463902 RepID=UPI00131E1D84|nr:hypothetical protein [Streptomyces sp. NRRL S-350]